MNDQLHDMNRLSISPNDAWQQMQAVLNEKLPVKKPFINKAFLMRYLAVAILLPIMLLISYQLTDPALHVPLLVRLASSSTSNAKDVVLPPLQKKDAQLEKSAMVPGSLLYESNSMDTTLTKIFLPATLPEWINGSSATLYAANSKHAMAIINKDFLKNIKAFTVLGTGKQSVAIAQAGIRNRMQKGWGLWAGVGVNAIINNKQSLQPYPVAEVKYFISPVLYVAAGLSVGSPAGGSDSGITRTVLINDTVNNIRMYNELSSYSHLRYADIPISAGIKLSRNLTIQGGVQLSVLISKKSKKILQPYDFQMNSVTNPQVSAALPNTQQGFNVQPHTIDYRIKAGLRYTVNRLEAGLDYQHSLTPASANNGRNNLLAFSILLKLK